jgi:hypothetical protein
MRWLIVAVSATVARVAYGDLANNEAIHDHVDDVVRSVERAKLDPARRAALFANRLELSASALVPIYGSLQLDRKVFGGVRPAAVVFDWILGGVAPVTLAVIALEDTALSNRTRSICAWTALGLYTSTRLGVLIVGNLHVSEFNRYLALRLDVAATPASSMAVVSTVW